MKTEFASKLKSLSGFVLGASLGLMLVASIVFAWNAVWHGTDFIQTGKVIPAKEIAENFEYLKQEISTEEFECSTVTENLIQPVQNPSWKYNGYSPYDFNGENKINVGAYNFVEIEGMAKSAFGSTMVPVFPGVMAALNLTIGYGSRADQSTLIAKIDSNKNLNFTTYGHRTPKLIAIRGVKIKCSKKQSQ